MHVLLRTIDHLNARSSALLTEDEAAAISPVKVWPFRHLRSARPVGFSLDQRLRMDRRACTTRTQVGKEKC